MRSQLWRVFLFLAAVVCCTTLAAEPVFADAVSWSGIAPNWTPLSNPFTTTSQGGITVTGSMPTSNVLATMQCEVVIVITPCLDGSFLPTDPLLYTNNTIGPLTFTFSAALSSFSTQINTIWYGPFTATLTAFDGNGNVIGTVSLMGTTAATHDGSAPTLVFTSGAGNIVSVSITATSAFPNSNYDGFFVNQLNITPSPVPEPGTLALLGTGIAALLSRKRMRGKAL